MIRTFRSARDRLGFRLRRWQRFSAMTAGYFPDPGTGLTPARGLDRRSMNYVLLSLIPVSLALRYLLDVSRSGFSSPGRRRSASLRIGCAGRLSS